MAATSKPMPRHSHSEPGLRLAARSGLDVMLTDAVLADGGVGRFLKPRAAARTIAGLARHPRRTARDAGRVGASGVARGDNTMPVMTAAPDRHARRREATRAKLVDAAKALFARQGVDNTRIQEITDEADVGFGSFYNHFESKEALIEVVLGETIAAQGAEIDALAQLDDPAEIISAAHRSFVRRARDDPDWGWLLVRLDVSHNILLAALGPYARRDLRAGVRSGRLSVSHEGIALYAAGGALLAVMRAVLDGKAPKDADIHHAAGVLRLFGLPADEAAEVARRPLPATS
jgi:AcrR family transcriptional regulator